MSGPLSGPLSGPYRMPAEWEPHAGTWLAWPHRTSDWPGKYTVIPWVYGEIIRTLSRYERVNVIVRDAEQLDKVDSLLQKVHADRSNTKLYRIPTDRSWVRDSGPIFVQDSAKQKVALDWHFNAWAKYDDWKLDDKLPGSVAKSLGVPAVQPKWNGTRVVLEGGSIDVNGTGLMLTTEECLLSEIQQRNPKLTRNDYEAVFKEYLGIEQVLWLHQGIVGDDTHGHVDDLARFVDENTIVIVQEHDEHDANYQLLCENRERLEGMRNLRGKRFTIVDLPMPRPVVFRGQRLPASYANFYIANGVVIVPTFNDPADRVALGTLAELFPDRDVIGIHCIDLVWGLGTLHCMTQQEPHG